MADVVRMAELRGDNTLVLPEQALEDALGDIRAGEATPNKALVIMLDTRDEDGGEGGYSVVTRRCNLRCSEIIALCEVIKARMLVEMSLLEPEF